MTKAMCKTAIVVGLALAAGPFQPSSAVAGPLPSTAVPLTADEVTKMHADNTGVYPTTDEFFAADGSTSGIFGKPAKSVFFGKWIVNGNTLCTLNGSAYDAKIYTDCSAFWRDAGRVLVLWSTHSDGSKVDLVNGYFDATTSIRPGNLIAAQYKALGGL